MDQETVHYEVGQPADVTLPSPTLVPLHYQNPEDSVGERTAPAKKGVIDKNNGHFFGVVSEKYRLVDHKEVLSIVEDTVGTTQFGKAEAKITTFKQGGILHAEYRFPEVKIPIDGQVVGDIVNPVIHVLNSYDSSMPLEILLGAYRLVCLNGMTVMKDYYSFRKKHQEGVLAFREEDLEKGMLNFEHQVTEWKRWRGLTASVDEYGFLMRKMELGKKALQAIDQRISVDDDVKVIHQISGEKEKLYDVSFDKTLSVWGLFNALTWYITHQVKSPQHKLLLESQLRSGLRSIAA